MRYMLIREVYMSSLTIHGIDDKLRARLQEEATRHRRSMEEHARDLLQLALIQRGSAKGLGDRIHQRFAAIDTSQLQLPPREQLATPAELPK